MAVSVRDLQALVGRTDNDNRATATRPARAPVVPFSGFETAFTRDYPHLETSFERELGIVWASMKHQERACYTPGIMRDMRNFQIYMRQLLAEVSIDEMPVKYLVWASQSPRAWSLGGDLTSFVRMIRSRDEAGLRAYAHLAIDILHDNHVSCDLPILTVALIQGDAIGGGFEAMLTDDIVIAEKHAKFGLPEILFNLFPGMGAFSFLKRKVGAALARTLIEDGVSRTAEEMKDLGLVDIVCETGEGRDVLHRFVAENGSRFNTLRTLRQVHRRVDPVTRRELGDVVDMWVDLAMQLSDNDLRRMECLARVQEKKRVAH